MTTNKSTDWLIELDIAHLGSFLLFSALSELSSWTVGDLSKFCCLNKTESITLRRRRGRCTGRKPHPVVEHWWTHIRYHTDGLTPSHSRPLRDFYSTPEAVNRRRKRNATGSAVQSCLPWSRLASFGRLSVSRCVRRLGKLQQGSIAVQRTAMKRRHDM